MLLRFFSYPVKFLVLYGYGALFVWSVLEGEIGLMLAGWLASQHIVFTYSKVIIVAICGALIGDVFTFSVGRLFEKRALAWLRRHPKKQKQVDHLLKKYGEFVIVFERFIYGTHIPVLLTLGMSGYSYLRFILFDVIGVVLWAFTFVSIGYYFGHTAINIILFIQKNILAFLFFAGILYFLWKFSSKE